MATKGKYIALPIDGSVVQTTGDTLLEFTADNGKVIRVAVAPTPMTERPPNGYFRQSSGVDVLFYIIPASSIWIDDNESQKAIAVGYSDSPRQLVLLYPAVDVKKDYHGNVVDMKNSPILYRAVNPHTQMTVKSLVITSVLVSSTADVVPA